MKAPKIKAHCAILDVKHGRKGLLKIVGNHKHRVPVTLKGYIVGDWSRDDGTSIEFEIDVRSHSLGKPEAHKCPCIRCNPPRTRKSKRILGEAD